MNSNCGIYKITSPSGRVYIGESYSLKKRFYNYKSLNTEKQPKLHRSFLKYGVKNHTFEIIEECEIEELKCRERYWQDFYDVLNGGLNCLLTECGELKMVLSEETKVKISEAQKGEKNHMFGKTGELNHFYGKTHTDETKKIISEKAKERYKENPNPLKGTKMSEEVKNKLSKTVTDKYAQGYVHPNSGKTLTEETKKKISDTRKERGLGKRGKSSNARLVLCLETGVFYDCVIDASETYNINCSYLWSMLNPKSKDKNKTNLIYC